MSMENRVFKEPHPVGVLCKWKLATWVKYSLQIQNPVFLMVFAKNKAYLKLSFKLPKKYKIKR